MFFDVDGTLTPTSSGQHLAEFLGHAKVIQEVQAGYGAGRLSSQEAAILEARGWASRTPTEVRGFLESLPLVDGIAETVLWCRRRGLAPVLATLAWDVVGTHLCDRFGFERSCGPSLEMVDGCYSGEVAEQFDELSKRDFALSMAAELGLDPRRCAAVGDGRSDVPLFSEVGLAIAFSATPAARAAADVAVDGTDLRAVLPLLDAWLRGR
jgi:phosphoserine phosphatase